jgi:hypothetical protein
MENTTTNPVTYTFDISPKFVLAIRASMGFPFGVDRSDGMVVASGSDAMQQIASRIEGDLVGLGPESAVRLVDEVHPKRIRIHPADHFMTARFVVDLTFATETDAVLFRLTHGDTFSNPRAVA